MSDATGCPQCGGTSPGIGRSRLCPACLLRLALEADEGPEPDDDVDGPVPIYRVLTILASEDDRTVYLAEQDRARRLVTLDVVRVAVGAPGDQDGGCRHRVRALMRWSHPSVPRTIDGRRTHSGDFCVVAHHVTGPALDRYCESRGLHGQDRARLFSIVCDIVADGHRHGICHGRLRPDLVIADVVRTDVVPIVLGYSVLSGRVPTVADDLAGLERIARAMGWRGAAVSGWKSLDDLRAAASADWPAAVAQPASEATRG